jgi:mannose-P-dolichol utilization defect protein 1
LDPTRADTMSPASVERCVGEFRATLTRGALPSSECVSFGVSKGLSLGIVAGAVLVKVPQISRIVANGSAKGLRVSMFRSEVLSGTVAIAYFARSGIALAAYAELFFILLQNLVILALIHGFRDGEKKNAKGKNDANDRRAGAVAFAFAAHVATVALLAFGVLANVSDKALETLYNCTTAVLIAGRAPQIAANFQTKSTGELSFASQALMSLGSAARIFTTAQEGGGVSMLLAYGMSSFMNWAILAQMLLYSKGGSSGKKRSARGARAGKRKTN